MLQAAETLFCQKSTNELPHPAHPESGSSQAADGTFPANSTAPWKNICAPCQGPDPIRAATAPAAAAPSERRIQQIKADCEQPVWEPGLPLFPQHPQGESRHSQHSEMQCQLSHLVSGVRAAQSSTTGRR